MDDNLKNRFGMIVILTALGMVFISAAGFAQEKKNPLTEALFNRAEKNMVEGNFDAAIADYSKIIVLQPTAVDAYYGRGKAYFRKGDYQKSIDDHTKELELKPNRSVGRLERGNALFKLNKVDEALKDYNRTIEFSLLHAGFYARGVAFEAKRDYPAAIGDLRYYIEKVPDDRKVRLLLTKLGVNPRELPAPLISENIPRPTKQALTAVFENIEQAYYDDAIGGLTKTIKNNPKFGPAYFYRGYILEIQAWERNAEKINADYTKAIELDSTFVEAYLSRARFAFFHHQEVNSRTDIARAIALNPKSARAVYYRSIFTYGQDNRTKELSDLNLALKLNPNFAEAYFTRGLFFELIKKQYDKAISDYSAILKINPNDILAYYQRAKVYCEANKKELAAADERKVVELGGNIDSPCTKN